MTSLKQIVIGAVLTLSLVSVAHAGTITGSRTGVSEARTGTITGSRTGTITGSRTGTITGSRVGTITGSATGASVSPSQEAAFDLRNDVLTRAMMLVLSIAW